MDDGTYDMDIDVGPGRESGLSMGTLVLSRLTHNSATVTKISQLMQATTTTRRTMTSIHPSNLTLTQESGACR